MIRLGPKKAAQQLNQIRFWSEQPCRNGHVGWRWTSSNTCIFCPHRPMSRKAHELRRIRRATDPLGKHRKREKQRYYDNRSSILAKRKIRYEEEWADQIKALPEEEKERRRQLKRAAGKKDTRRATLRAYYKAKKAGCLSYRINNTLRGAIWRSLKRRGMSKGGMKTFTLLGFSVSELISHLEKQFTPGMCWANYGKWEIDHRIPLAWFEITGLQDEQFKQAWSLQNLRPLWALENQQKGARWASCRAGEAVAQQKLSLHEAIDRLVAASTLPAIESRLTVNSGIAHGRQEMRK